MESGSEHGVVNGNGGLRQLTWQAKAISRYSRAFS